MIECGDIRERLLESESPDEILNSREEIREHVQSCPRCSALLKQINLSDKEVELLKSSAPSLQDPDLLTNKIMYSIAKETARRQTHSTEFFSRIYEWAGTLKLRLALYAVIILLTGSYLYEETAALNKILKLESRLAESGRIYQASLNNNLPGLSFFNDTYKLLKGEKHYLHLSKEWLLVNKDLLKNLLSELESLNPRQKGEIEKLKDGLSPEQKELLDELLNINKMPNE